jgi:hypothetical protein
MQNFTPAAHARQSQTTSEISDALRTANLASFRLSDEYHPFDWEARLELADELRRLSDNAPEDLAPIAREVAHRLESEANNFADWEERFEAANICRVISAGLQRQGGAR